jgi:hypothetical protein
MSGTVTSASPIPSWLEQGQVLQQDTLSTWLKSDVNDQEISRVRFRRYLSLDPLTLQCFLRYYMTIYF